jgi:CPA2 family monovalent cation:H+ antiporter-2
MGWNTLVYGILTVAVIAVMFMFVHPFLLPIDKALELSLFGYRLSLSGIVTCLLTLMFIAPFLRAMVMKKNRSEEFRALWAESNRNRLPLLFTILVRFILAVAFVFSVVSHLAQFRPAIIIMFGVAVIVIIILSRKIKKRSILLERLFINNLRSRDINAQVHGEKRPLYEARLLDRDVHIADFLVPSLSLWTGRTLKQLDLGRKYGVHVSSILREGRRLNIPDGDSILFPHDKLQVIGSDSQLEQLHKALETEVVADDYAPENHEMKLRQLIIAAGSPFVGKTLQESGIRSHYSCMVVGLEEGKENLSPVSPQYRFQEGDIIWVVGEQKALNALV